MPETIGANTRSPLAAAEAVRERLDEVIALLKRVRRMGPRKPETIHRLRVSIRRAASALSVFEPMLDPGAKATAQKRLRRVRRAAGGVRAADVHIKMLKDGLGGRIDPRDRALLRIAKAIKSERRDHRQRLMKRVRRDKPRHFRSDGEALVAGLLSMNGALAAERFIETARRALRSQVASVQASGDEAASTIDSVHECRIAAKRLRYSLEVFAPCFETGVVGPALEWLTRVQDHLGQVNDLEELLRLLGTLEGAIGVERPRSLIEAERDAAYMLFAGWWRSSGRSELERVFRPMISTGGPPGREPAAGPLRVGEAGWVCSGEVVEAGA